MHATTTKKLVCGLLRVTFFFILMVSLRNVQALEGTIKNFKIPLINDSLEDKGTIRGGEARFVDEKKIEILKADVSFHVTEMARTWNVKTEQCFFHKDKNEIWTQRHVLLESNGIYIDGQGFRWYLNDGILTIHQNVTVDIEKKNLEDDHES